MIISLAIVLCLAGSVRGLIEPIDMPPELAHCLHHYDTVANVTVNEAVYNMCLKQFLWRSDVTGWKGFNMTESQVTYINSLIESLIYRPASDQTGRRHRRQTMGVVVMPPSGYRTRKEYRRMLPLERNAFHGIIRIMFARGQYQAFATLHSGIVEFSAHEGPNFLGWHRVYLALFEEALRRYDRSIALPYWDTTLDFVMENPANSIIWTSSFLGNGDGVVTNGPFANWMTPVGRLTRNIGAVSQLISKAAVARILTRCRTMQIAKPTAQPDFDLEFMHNGPHRWVSGLMQGLNTAAHDPVFFLMHAFVDYIWEMFRMRQRTVCNVDPTSDYPPTVGLHSPGRVMDGFPIIRNYLNLQGYQNFWTQFWYGYEAAPTCTPSCGSAFLRCEEAVCHSVSRTDVGEFPVALFGQEAQRSRSESDAVATGTMFNAPPSDGRTQDALLARMRRFGRSTRWENHNNARPNSFRKAAHNTIVLDGKADVASWAYLAVKVITHSTPDTSTVSPVTESTSVGNHEFFNLPTHPHITVKTSEYCHVDESGSGQMLLKSDGLSYHGTFSDYTTVDLQAPKSSNMAVMAAKKPTEDLPTVILAAFDYCGRMCQAHCLVPDSSPPIYKPCSGAVRISHAQPRMYSDTYTDVVKEVWPMTDEHLKVFNGNAAVVFHCWNSTNSLG